jgi:ubiquinone/menaquinone biosynthesis C-methylase UbiE
MNVVPWRYMKNSTWCLLFIFGLVLSSGCQAQSSGKEQDGNYRYESPSAGGIGKFYMGREIAGIMDFRGKDWLERQSRAQEENTDLAIKNLPIHPASVVADIGAGSGFYTFRVAPRIPNGKIYAVEIQESALKFLEDRSKELGYDHVIPVLGEEKSPNLPANSLDLIYMVDVYHELEYPVEMLAAIRKALKPDGKLLLIEYRAEDPEVRIRALHKMTVVQIQKELSANGFKMTNNGQFMNIQHFLIFEKDDR